MIYTKTITTVKNTAAIAPMQTDLKVTAGLIYKVEFDFPPGSSGLLHLMVKDGAYQVWPSTPGETFFGDNTIIAFDDRYWIKAPDHRLLIFTYNLDDTYDHMLQVRVGQVLEDVFISSFLPGVAQKDVAEMIARILTSQEDVKAAQQKELIEYFTGKPYEPETVLRQPLPSEE